MSDCKMNYVVGDLGLGEAREQRLRPPSEAGRRLQSAARSLRRYFASIADMADALGTTRDTLRVWLSDDPPTRPRLELIERVQRLDALASHARRFLDDDRQVGAWLLAPQPALRGASPAQLARDGGDEAVEVLGAQIVALAPTAPSRPLSIPTAEELRARMAEVLDGETMHRLDARVAALRSRRLSEADIEASIDAAVAADTDAD